MSEARLLELFEQAGGRPERAVPLLRAGRVGLVSRLRGGDAGGGVAGLRVAVHDHQLHGEGGRLAFLGVAFDESDY